MNAFRTKKMMRLGVAAGAVLFTSGCAARFDAAADASSPASARVEALVEANRAYPRWEDFPPAPVNPPQPAQIAAQVNTLRATSGALAGEVSRIDWDLTDPAAFAAAVNARIDSSKVTPLTAQTQADIEVFAQRLRDRATAPPPIGRR